VIPVESSDTHTRLVAGNGLFGVGFRRPYYDQLDAHAGVDFLEIVSENFMDFGGRPRWVLERALLVTWLKPPWFSDHLCYASAYGVEYHDLLPLPFSEQAVKHVVARVDEVQHRIGYPLLLENPSYYMVMPGAEMDEATFLREVVERADCGLLLDVNNVYVNSVNHSYDPYDFIDALPLERVRQIHIGGHDASGPFIIDTHGEACTPAVLDLYRHVLEKIGPTWTLFEWDNHLPPLEMLLEQNCLVRAVAERTLRETGARRRVRDAAVGMIAS
jgi:uncharacterized protein (UPF0276 family)